MDLSLKDLKAEVRKLRKEHCPPVSKLKKEALKKEHEHLASLGMKSPNVVHKEEVAEPKKMPKIVRLVRTPMKEEVKEEVKEVAATKPKRMSGAALAQLHNAAAGRRGGVAQAMAKKIMAELEAEKEVKEEVKTGKKLSAYAEFVKKHKKGSMSMKDVAELWKKSKK
jgi:hypothetical protein